MNLFNLLASGTDLANVLKSFLGLWWGPMMIAIGSAGAVIGLIAGVKYFFAVQSGDENKIKAARQFLIGIVTSIVIAVLFSVIIPILVGWLGDWGESQTVDFIQRIII